MDTSSSTRSLHSLLYTTVAYECESRNVNACTLTQSTLTLYYTQILTLVKTHTQTHTCLLLPTSTTCNLPPSAEGIKIRGQNPSPPTRTLSSPLRPSSTKLGNSLNFPGGHPTRTGTDLLSRVPTTHPITWSFSMTHSQAAC